MVFQDDEGNIWMSDEAGELSPWELEDLNLHVYEEGL